ncbi:hypothetical protein SAMN06297382_0652 [Amphiplicatus metriothermophilus]|uniref:Uncharacterized protein n=1 Tax=Amphiplicatus metriothermophilus TaxID=1519374 RepID=A0A239PK32_9PROT|nr:hypothetical protein [Amphiplicatus metriothermophilus]SNT68156.1 hypothetical protein SAMN06297382_0652 [Amphiplicatus metriothermophilus]
MVPGGADALPVTAKRSLAEIPRNFSGLMLAKPACGVKALLYRLAEG